MTVVRVPSPAIGMLCRAHRRRTTTATATALRSTEARHLSSAPTHRQRRTPDAPLPPPRRDEPWWSLASLHERAATALASALPAASRAAVRRSLAARPDLRAAAEAEDRRAPTSIGEAIVSARAREQAREAAAASSSPAAPRVAERQRELEQEIEARIQEKAQERMRLELRAMEERWQRREAERVDRDREERESREEEHRRELAFERWKEDAATERRKEEQEAENGRPQNAEKAEAPQTNSLETPPPESRPSQDRHPVLGLQIAQLPYKRVHLTPAATLAALPVYEKQRAYRHDRAQLMAKDKKKTLWMGVPGVISLMEDEDGRLSVLDGQHRVGMMALLGEEQRRLRDGDGGGGGGGSGAELAALDLDHILVEVLLPRRSAVGADADSVLAGGQSRASQHDDDRAAVFTEINKAEPVRLLDLPGAAPRKTRAIIDHAADHFRDAYPAMFSASPRCRAPHLHLDNLREALFAAEVVKREGAGSGGELVRWLAGKNAGLRERYGEGGEGDGGDGRRASAAALRKARKHDLYLGLDSSWLYK